MSAPLIPAKLAIIFFLVALTFGLFLLGEQYRNWSQNADQELTLAYNALLANSNEKQEYLDHTGFFTIQVLAQLINLKHFLGLSSIFGIGDLNSSLLLVDGLSDIVTTAHFLAFFSTLVLLIATFCYCYENFQENIPALLITIAILFTDASITHYIQLRTELVASLLLFLSLFIFSQVNVNNKKSGLWLYLGLVVLFFSSLNKIQIILYIPFYLFWAIHSWPVPFKNKAVLFFNKTEILRAICVSLLCYLFFIFRAKGASILFYFLFLSSINLLVFYYWLKNGGNLAKQITIFNAAYLLAYGSSLLIVHLLGGYPSELFHYINSPMEMTVFMSNNLIGMGTSQITTSNISTLLVDYFLKPAQVRLTSLNSSSFLFYINLMLLIFNRENAKTKKNVVICLTFFYLISIISGIRSFVNHYAIFSEFFLIVALIKQINTLRFKKIFCIFILLALFSINIDLIQAHLLNSSNDIKRLCIDTYMTHWHRHLDLQKFYNQCKEIEK